MFPDKKTTATIPLWVAVVCCVIIVAVLAYTAIHANTGTINAVLEPSRPSGMDGFPAGYGPTRAVMQGICPPFVQKTPAEPAVTETLDHATITLTQPAAGERVPYTGRGFSEPVEAAVAWWMSPGFMDNTTEFRAFERKTKEGRAAYPEEHRVFFNFIEHSLDTAEQQSHLEHDMLLFRGINPSVAGIVMNTSEYREPAFASTSYDISFSLDAFGLRSHDGYRNMLVIRRNRNDHALYINEDEREYLLPRGMNWSVVRISNVRNLSVNADFPLHNRTTNTALFDHVRLIYIRELPCG